MTLTFHDIIMTTNNLERKKNRKLVSAQDITQATPTKEILRARFKQELL